MRVCIDPGHGGTDPGAVGNGLYEKDITLDICLKLKPLLEYNGITAMLTREGDYSPGHLNGDCKGKLRARVDIAEKNKADLFLSIHVNAGGGTGEEILIISKGGRAETVAKKVLPYVVQAGDWTNRGVKVQNLQVLRETTMPAIITENGFIDNPQDALKLKNPEFRKALAKAHAQGICDYFGLKYQDMIPLSKDILYHELPNGEQVMALSTPQNALAEVKTSILGSETITPGQCQQYLLRHNPNAQDIIPYYEKYGEILGIRWGLAVAQMIRETGYLKFGGDVLPEQNNYAGIGAVGGGVQGAVFSTPEEGVLAHLQHLYAYSSLDPLPVGMSKLDPRFDLVKRGSCPNWEDLNGRWAVPGNGYGEDIVSIYEKMLGNIGAVLLVLRKISALISDLFDGGKSNM